MRQAQVLLEPKNPKAEGPFAFGGSALLTHSLVEYIMYSVRVISISRLRDFWAKHAKAEAPLRGWYVVAKHARWRNVAETRRSFPHADAVKVASGNTVTVFNVAGNAYRLIAALHYNRETVYVLRVMTHAEYDRGKWKDEL